MQPRTLAFVLFLLPLFASNSVYLISASLGTVPWCITYIDGCTSISRSARTSDAIYLFRATMIPYAVLMILFWWYVKLWLEQLGAATRASINVITTLGTLGACSLIVYVVFLGSEGEVYRFMRRHGVLWFFTATPLAMLLLYRQHMNPENNIDVAKKNAMAIRIQLSVLLLLLAGGLVHVSISLVGLKTDAGENIVEWTFSLLLDLYFIGMIMMWKDFRIAPNIRV